MSQRCRSLLVLAVVLVLPASVAACLWDYDTLKQERSRFPSTLELITGKFLRHSPEFYEWRIRDRANRLTEDSEQLSYYDDLAVAYQKTGQTEKAIQTMLDKEKIKPGLYETYSNLGTFYILAGQFKEGLPWIDKALAINPNAHFGRERYQKWLVEYALAQAKDGKLAFPLQSPGNRDYSRRSFRDFLAQRLEKHLLTQADIQSAVQGVQGMMRFANHDNPLLLEALGDLLAHSYSEPTSDAKQLAARAYLQASYQFSDQATREAYRQLANEVLDMQLANRQTHERLDLIRLEIKFSAERADADKWYADLRERELRWIRAGKNVDAEFDKLYTAEPQALEHPEEVVSSPETNSAVLAICYITLWSAIFAACWLVTQWVRRKTGR